MMSIRFQVIPLKWNSFPLKWNSFLDFFFVTTKCIHEINHISSVVHFVVILISVTRLTDFMCNKALVLNQKERY